MAKRPTCSPCRTPWTQPVRKWMPAKTRASTDFRGGLRKTVVASRAARCRERVMDPIGVEIPAQYFDRRARIRRQAARIVRVQRRDEQRRPGWVAGRRAIAIGFTRPNRRDWTPEVVRVLRVVHRYRAVGKRYVHQCEETCVLPWIEPATGDDNASDCVPVRAAARPEPGNGALVGGTVAADFRIRRTDALHLVVVACVGRTGEVEDLRRVGTKLRAAIEREWNDVGPARPLRIGKRGRCALVYARSCRERVGKVRRIGTIPCASLNDRCCGRFTGVNAVFDARRIGRRTVGQLRDAVRVDEPTAEAWLGTVAAMTP